MPLNTEEYENALEVGDRVKIINTENVWEDKQGEIINKINDDIYTVGVIFAPGKIVHQDFEKEHLELLNGGRLEMAEDYKKDNEVYVYEFNAADINDNDAELLYKYNLTPIGEVKDLNYPEEENNYAVKGKLKDLNKFAYDIYYELHPDYLTLEKDYDYEDREWIEEPNLYEECNYHETASDDILNEAEDKYTKKLPTRVSISMYDLEYDPETDSEDYLMELINNYLSDNYGYLVSGYSYDVKKDRVIVSNISWDLEESYYDSYKTEDKEMGEKLDWGRLYITTLSYNDLDLEVEDTFVEFTNTNDPLSDYGDTGEKEYTRRGVINYWDYYIDLTLDDIARYLNKDKEEITQRDIDNIDEEDLYDFLLDYYRRDAEKDAAEKHEVDDVYYYAGDDWRDDYERD